VFQISIAEGKNPVGESAARQNPVTIGGVDGDNKIVGLVLNSDGSITAKLAAGTAITGKFIPVDADGDEKFTAANPASVQLTGSLFPVVINIIPAFAVSTTAVPQSFTNQNITVHVLSGNCWYNPNTTSTTSNGFKLLPGMAIDLRVNGTLSLISDSTGATVQIAVWGS